LYPNSPKSQNEASSAYSEDSCHFTWTQFPRAKFDKKAGENLKTCKRHVETRPDCATYNFLGYLHSQNNDYSQAEACFSKAIELDPNDTVAIYNQIHLYSLTKRPRFAEEWRQKLKTVNQDRANGLKHWAMAYYHVRIFENSEAVIEYDKALHYLPHEARLYLLKAISLNRNFKFEKAIDTLLDGEFAEQDLLKAASFLKKMQEKNRPLSQCNSNDFPIEFIPARIKPYLMDGSPKTSKAHQINPYKYEFFVYQQLKSRIEATNIYANDTTQYKNFDSDLDLGDFDADIQHILKDTKLNKPIEQLLEEYEKTLDELFSQVNNRILRGENKAIKIKDKDGKKTWRLPYIKKEEEVNNPFYDNLPAIPIEKLLDHVNEHCNLMKAFSHIKPHGAKHQLD